MKNINFEDYKYFPTLRTRQAEIKGLKELDAQRKSKILPLLTLGRWPRAEGFEKAAEESQLAMSDLPYFLDLTTDPSHLSEQQLALRNPDDAFGAWRTFCRKYENAIPVIQFAPNGKVREFTKQVQEFEKERKNLAFRIKEFSEDTPQVVHALSAMDDPRNAMVFIDCQYIRSSLAAYTAAAIGSINRLRSEFPGLIISILSTSFPSSVIPFSDASQKRGSIDILERELHAKIGGSNVAAYGDHASIHSVVYDNVPMMRWSPRIDYPRNFDWTFERRPGLTAADGYIDAAQAISTSDPDIGTRNIWGEQMIIDAANGEPYAKAPASWIAVRVNIHLSRQLDLSESIANISDSANEDDELENY